MRILIFTFLFLGCATSAFANVEVTLEPSFRGTLETLAGKSVEAMEREIEAELEAGFRLVEPSLYLTQITDAHSFSNKGIGADYGTLFDGFIIGASANLSLNLGNQGLEKVRDGSSLPSDGFAPGLSVMLGLNLGFMGLDQTLFYVNGFNYSTVVKSSSYPDGALRVTLKNIGAHLQMKFFQPGNTSLDLLFRWGGFDVTTGFEYSYLGMTLDKELRMPIPVDSPPGLESLELNFLGNGTMEIRSTAMIVPVEFSTNLRLLYVLTVFGGVGFDFQLGGADMDVALSGDLVGINPQDGSEINAGRVTVEGDEMGKPSVGKVRFFGGVQANVWLMKVFAQANLLPNKSVGLTLGVRVAW
ncbi:MAG: hypothetical protein VYA34_06085 [Myxococcota bacterium]|nr:hypothetical protein [Myxococcota bacterium]